MKTPILIAGTAVIGIAIGFVAGSSRGERGANAKDGAAEVSTRTKSTRRTEGAGGSGKQDSVAGGLGKGRDYAKMSAADALVQVKANADFYGGDDPLESARKNYEYQLMLSKLPLKELEQLIALSQDEGVPIYRTRQLFGAYASRDLNKAMAWAAGQPDPDSWKGAAIGATAARDPGKAMEMYQETLFSGTYNPYGGMDGGYTLAGSFAKQGKAALLQFLDSMPANGAGNYVSNAVRNLPKEDLPGFMEELEKRAKDGKIEQWSLQNAMSNLASTDPAMARSLIEKMEPGQERATRELQLAGNLSQQGKTAEAMEMVKSAMAQQPGKEKDFIINQTGGMYYSNPGFINQLVAELPAGVEMTMEDVKKLGDRGGRQDPVNLAKLLKSPDDQAAYLEEAIKNIGNRGSRMNETDYRVLEHRVQSLGLTGDSSAKVQAALAASKEKAQGKK